MADRHFAWAVKTAYQSPLDGWREYLHGGARFDRPSMFSGCVIMVFKTRKLAREHIEREHGYLRTRDDLKKPPFCWRMPKPVRVEIITREVAATPAHARQR